MSVVLPINSVKETTLWKQLDVVYRKTSDAELASQLSNNVIIICEKATERIKLFPYYHPQYTLHDQNHMLRVCELMAMVAGESCAALNPIEIFLLICAAHMHDQGMVPDAIDWERTKSTEDFRISLERWEVENPNLREIRQQLHNEQFSDDEQSALRSKEQEMLDAHRTDFLRITHGKRSEDIVNQLFGASDLLDVAIKKVSATVLKTVKRREEFGSTFDCFSPSNSGW